MLILPKSNIKLSSSISIKGKEHTRLLNFLHGRLEMGKDFRDQYLEIFKNIDREYYGYLRREQDDNKRDKDNRQGKGVKPVDEKLSLIFAQLDEAVTYLLTVLAPDEAMYTAQAPEQNQKVASGFAALLNKHAEKYHHYRHLALFLQSALRYNLGAFSVEWEETFGNVLRKSKNSLDKIESVRERIFHGNKIEAFDLYNLLLDPSVNPVDIAEEGNFFSSVKVQTPFAIKKAEADKDFQNVEDFLRSQDGQFSYFETHPKTRDDFSHINANYTDWTAIFRARDEIKDAADLREINTMYVWLRPNEFKLSKDKEYQIWKFKLGGTTHILHGKHMDNAHGMLPINIAVPFEDHFQLDAKGAAERLIPHQRFASFVMNTHQRAVRKKLYGLTVYDSNAIPLLDTAEVDMAGGKIPASGGALDMDIRKKIIQFNDGPDTTNSLENIKAMNDLMQNVMPTNIQNQVAGLERATQYQAAALVQGANRRNLKLAKIINAQAMDNGRYQQMQNVFQMQDIARIIGNDGKIIDINPAEFIDAEIEFTISDGLKGLDRLALTMNMQDLFNSILQSKQAAEQVDVVKLMDYMSTLYGDYTDFSQFKLESPIDSQPTEIRDLAFKLLQQFQQEQQGGGNNPTGATNV